MGVVIATVKRTMSCGSLASKVVCVNVGHEQYILGILLPEGVAKSG
jgi:hypothetical protein